MRGRIAQECPRRAVRAEGVCARQFDLNIICSSQCTHVIEVDTARRDVHIPAFHFGFPQGQLAILRHHSLIRIFVIAVSGQNSNFAVRCLNFRAIHKGCCSTDTAERKVRRITAIHSNLRIVEINRTSLRQLGLIAALHRSRLQFAANGIQHRIFQHNLPAPNTETLCLHR